MKTCNQPKFSVLKRLYVSIYPVFFVALLLLRAYTRFYCACFSIYGGYKLCVIMQICFLQDNSF